MNIPEEFYCPISLEIMTDPVICEDGYSYDRSSILKLTNNASPITRQKISKRRLVPNRALKHIIDLYFSKNPLVKPKKKINLIKRKIIIPKYDIPKSEIIENPTNNDNNAEQTVIISQTNINVEVYVFLTMITIFLINILLRILVPIFIDYFI